MSTDTFELSFGDLDWSPAAQVDDVQVSVFGLSRGKAVPVVQVVESLIQDGGLERVDSFGNRDQQVVLAIDASDSQALAEYEATLFREVQKVRNELRWTPPDGFGATAVFDVLWADLTFADSDALWDLDEVMRGRRNYVLTLRCLPFARSVDPFTVTGVTSGGSTTTTVNDASSTTGWSATGSTLGSGSGEVWVDVDTANQDPAGQPYLTYAPASPVDFTGLPFLIVTWRVVGLAGPFDPAPSVTADGVALSRVANRYDSASSRYISTYVCSDTSVASLRITSPRVSGFVGGGTTGTFRVDNVSKSNVAPSTGSTRQKVTSLEIPGSARTPATIEVSHATLALGDGAIVYTCPDLAAGYIPALSVWAETAGTVQAGNVSGYNFAIGGGGYYFSIPANLLPRGSYQLLARARVTGSPATATITSTVNTRLNSIDLDPAVSSTVRADLDTTYGRVVALGSFEVPPADVPVGSSALVRVGIQGAGVTLDEAWLFYLPDDNTAHLSVVDCGTGSPSAGGPASRLWLNAATVDRPYPSCFIGTDSTGADAFAPSGAASNWTEHNIPAGPVTAWVVTPDATDALVEVSGFARWHTHPAE